MRILFVIILGVGLSATAHAGCDRQELPVNRHLKAQVIGDLAGVRGRHRCKRAQIKIYNFYPHSHRFQARCQPRGSRTWVTVGHGPGYTGILEFERDCSVAMGDSKFRTWYVEGTPTQMAGGRYDGRKATARLSNGLVLKVWNRIAGR